MLRRETCQHTALQWAAGWSGSAALGRDSASLQKTGRTGWKCGTALYITWNETSEQVNSSRGRILNTDCKKTMYFLNCSKSRRALKEIRSQFFWVLLRHHFFNGVLISVNFLELDTSKFVEINYIKIVFCCFPTFFFAVIFETYSFSLVFKTAPKTFVTRDLPVPMKHFVPQSVPDELKWNPIKTTAISRTCLLVPVTIICTVQTTSLKGWTALQNTGTDTQW